MDYYIMLHYYIIYCTTKLQRKNPIKTITKNKTKTIGKKL